VLKHDHVCTPFEPRRRPPEGDDFTVSMKFVEAPLKQAHIAAVLKVHQSSFRAPDKLVIATASKVLSTTNGLSEESSQ